MSKKRKVEIIQEVQEVKSEMISYKDFFNKCMVKGIVQPWQEKEIHAFFRGLGLQDKEPIDTYKIALSKY